MRLLTLVTLLITAALAPCALAAPLAGVANPWLDRELTREELLPALEQSAGYLVRQQLASGQFIYVNDPRGRSFQGKADPYSLIRHLGGIYALLRAFELTRDKALLNAARKGLDFALRFRDAERGPRIMRGLKGTANLGENGFLLLTAVLHDALTGTDTYAALTDDLASFVATNLVYDGKYATEGQWAECQAIIGMLLYYRHRRQDPALVAVARRWLEALEKEGKSSHWSVQAIQWLEATAPSKDDKLVDHALIGGRRIIEGVLTRKGPGDRSRNVGARLNKLQSCAATARNEGILACHALARARGRDGDARYFLDRAKEHLAFALQFQFGQPGNLLDHDPIWKRLARVFDLRGGVFNDARHGYVRIDYVAHHVRAIALYLGSGDVPRHVGLSMADLATGAR